MPGVCGGGQLVSREGHTGGRCEGNNIGREIHSRPGTYQPTLSTLLATAAAAAAVASVITPGEKHHR